MNNQSQKRSTPCLKKPKVSFGETVIIRYPSDSNEGSIHSSCCNNPSCFSEETIPGVNLTPVGAVLDEQLVKPDEFPELSPSRSDKNQNANVKIGGSGLNNLGDTGYGTNDSGHECVDGTDDAKCSSSGTESNASEQAEPTRDEPEIGGSFASVLRGNNHTKSVPFTQFSEMHNDEQFESASVVLPLDLIRKMHEKFGYMLFGYFLGKRIPFPIVEKYVRNVWTKFGLERVMLKNGFYLFQFSYREGMDSILRSGPWMIRLSPLFLNIWTPDTILKKEMMTRVPLWVKLYNLPLVACSDIGLSLISSKIGRPIMMDSFTSNMCLNPWGDSNFARVLIEVRSDEELPTSVVVAIPNLEGTTHSLETVTLEYEWLPPRCSMCKVFDHKDDQCSNMIKPDPVLHSESQIDKEDDGFVDVKSKKNRKKKNNKSNQVAGVKLSKPDLKLVYRPIEKEKQKSSCSSIKGRNGGSNGKVSTDVPFKNGFEGLNEESEFFNESDSDDEIILEDPDGIRKGADNNVSKG